MYKSAIMLMGSVALAMALGLQGCKGELGDTTTSTTTTTTTAATNATGVWSGSDADTGLALVGIINAAGEAAFLRSDGVLYTGLAQVSSGALAIALDGYANFGATFSDGSTYGVGTLSGTVTASSALSGTVAFTTSAGTSVPGSWSLTYDALSTTGSSLSAVSGNYTDATSGATVSITGGGVMTSQVPANSCVLNGTIASADTSIDVYEVSYTYASCTGSYAVLNGVTFSGLAVLDTTVSPVQIVMGVTSAPASGSYGIYSVLTAT